jgi:hypothetical protein
MFRLNAALFHLAARFTGKYPPFQGITLSPLAGGVCVAASDRGAVTFVGFDPLGHATDTATFLPSSELVTPCRGIKTAQRELLIEDERAKVTTYFKEHSNSLEFPVTTSSERPCFRGALREMLQFWGESPEVSSTAGRYDLALLNKAVKSMADDVGSLVISGYNGGPLRLQCEQPRCVVLLMPQTAEPIPPAPPWLSDYALSA